MYASPLPYIEKWRAAMRYLDEDRPYQKIWWELQAMAWNRPEYRPRIAAVLAAWREAMRGSVAEAPRALPAGGGGLHADDWITLIVAANEGIILERLSGIDQGHGSCWRRSTAGCRRSRTGSDARGGRCGRVSRIGRLRRARWRAQLYYEVFGAGEHTILFMPTWSVIHSRHWKAQVPYFARHYRVVTFDGRGNGRSDRPGSAAAYAEEEFAADALAVMDATGTERALLVSLSLGRCAR
jgi:hypothetical protein